MGSDDNPSVISRSGTYFGPPRALRTSAQASAGTCSPVTHTAPSATVTACAIATGAVSSLTPRSRCAGATGRPNDTRTRVASPASSRTRSNRPHCADRMSGAVAPRYDRPPDAIGCSREKHAGLADRHAPARPLVGLGPVATRPLVALRLRRGQPLQRGHLAQRLRCPAVSRPPPAAVHQANDIRHGPGEGPVDEVFPIHPREHDEGPLSGDAAHSDSGSVAQDVTRHRDGRCLVAPQV